MELAKSIVKKTSLCIFGHSPPSLFRLTTSKTVLKCFDAVLLRAIIALIKRYNQEQFGKEIFHSVPYNSLSLQAVSKGRPCGLDGL